MKKNLSQSLSSLFHHIFYRRQSVGAEASQTNLDLSSIAQKDTELLRGYFDQIDYADGLLTVAGWMLNPGAAYDRILLWINQKPYGEAKRIQRPDVAQVLTRIPHAEYCGFHFQTAFPVEEIRNFMEIRVVGMIRNEESASMTSWYCKDLYTLFPTPPPELIRRVDELTDARFYLLKGLQNYCEFRRLISQYRSLQTIQRMLDWGCGSGRLTGFFHRFSSIPEIYASDIDAEAVAWGSNHLPGIHFSVNPPFPPLEHPNSHFDLVIAFSVFTHLTQQDQLAWLQEIQRILKPGGLLVATLHGRIAARTYLYEKNPRTMLAHEIDDSLIDTRLHGIAPQDYYRAVYQTKEFTLKAWSRFFDILEYREGGASNYHDIVILRK